MATGLTYKPPASASNAIISEKLSRISPSPTAPALTDQLVGVKSGAIDQLYTLAQVQTTVLAGFTPPPPSGSSGTPFDNPVILDGTVNHFATYNIFNGTTGPYWVNLNLFNVGALTGFAFGAINYPDTFPNYTTFNWSWPSSGVPLWGYPEIVYGTQGGGNFSAGPANKPARKTLNNLGTLSLIYNLTLTTQSANDTSLLIETWAQTTPNVPASNTAEILFYAYATPAVSSFILAFATHFDYSAGGLNVYFARDVANNRVYMMPVTAPSGTTPLNMAQSGVTYSIDFAALITAALNAGWLTGTDSIGGYEVGFETRQGTGGAVFNRLEWTWSNQVNAPAPTRYYVSSAGSDTTGSGSLTSPWASIAKVNATLLNPGDSVLFAGGQTFTGAIVCPATGRPSNPITFGSYGGGQATIASTTSNGFTSTSQAGIVVRDLIFTGSASTNTGILFQNTNAGAAHLQNIKVINCNVSGYGQFGIHMLQANVTAGVTAGYDDVVIDSCTVASCCSVAVGGLGSAGIKVNGRGGYGLLVNAPSFNNVVISNCVVHDCAGTTDTQWTGSGIIISEVNNGLITGCIAYANGASSTFATGPIGIWMFDAVNSKIQDCISHDNADGGHADGGGFGLDGGCSQCHIIDCKSYNNNGPGYQIVQYSDASFITNNDRCSILNCSSINDGSGVSTGSPNGIRVQNDATLTNLLISGCVVQVSAAGTRAVRLTGGLPSAMTGSITGNCFTVIGAMTHINSGGNPTGMVFAGNSYFGAFNVSWNSVTYTSLGAWRVAIPQQEPSDQVLSVKATTGLEVATPGNIGWNSAGSAASKSFSLIGGPNGSNVAPVPTFYPTENNRAIAFDLCPHGAPTDLGYGVCWFDMTPTDQITSGNVATSTLHIGAHTTSIFIGTGQYVAGTVLPLNFGTFNGDTPLETISFTINTDATVTYAKALRGFAIVKAGAPTTSDLTASHWGVFKDSGGGGVVLAYNDAGTIKSVALV